MGLYGHLWGLDVFENGFDSASKAATVVENKEDNSLEKGKKRAFPSKLKIERNKRIEDSLRDLWNNIKCNNIRIIGAREKESD